MKKFLILILILIITPLSFNLSESRANTSPESRMLDDLIGYAYNYEIICTDLKWALEYCEKFNVKKSWENLQLARASIAIAKSHISKLKLDKRAMTSGDYKTFMARGMDVNFFIELGLQFEAQQTTAINTCTALMTSLMTDIFTRGDWAVCERKLKAERKDIELNLKYLANTIDWILAKLNDEKIAQKFNKLLEDNCPKTRAYQRKKPDSIKNIEAEAQNILNQINDLVSEQNAILGAGHDRLNSLKYAIEKNNFEPIKKDLMKISDLSASIPAPSWLLADDIYYFWYDNKGNIANTPRLGSKLTKIPDICRIRVKGVSLNAIKSYRQLLKAYNVPAAGASTKDHKLNIYYKIKNSEFNITWSQEQTEILMMQNPVHLVPQLYLDFNS